MVTRDRGCACVGRMPVVVGGLLNVLIPCDPTYYLSASNGQPHTYVRVLMWRADAHVAGLLRGIFQRLDKVSEEVKELKEASPM